MTDPAIIEQTRINIEAVLRHYGLSAGEVLTAQADRITARVPPSTAGTLGKLIEFRGWNFVKNHGTTAIGGWRECCPFYSLQIIQHQGGVFEFDIDYANPDFREGLGVTVWHGFEVLINRWRHLKTDPFRVRRGLLARGISVGLSPLAAAAWRTTGTKGATP